MDIYSTNGGRGDRNHRNRKRLSKTDIGIPQDFVHVATVKSPTKTEVNFNDALISEFLQRAEVSAAALSNPETQQCIKEFIQKVGLDAIQREIRQTKAEVSQIVNTENDHLDIHHTDEGEVDSSQFQSNDNSSIEFLPDHDIEITSEIDDVFTESDIPIASPKTPNQEDSEVEPKHSPKGACESQSQLESEELPKSPNPSDSDHTQEPIPGNGAKTPRKKSHHDNFLRELKEAIKKRNTRIKKRAEDEMNKSEEGWSKWNSPKKSKSYVSFSPLDSPPAKPTRTVHTLWDLTSDSHYNSETDFHDENVSETKDCPDGKKLSPNSVKLPLTKRTGAITKMASSEEIGDKKFLSSTEDSSEDSKTNTSTEVNEEGNVQKMKQDESNKENIQAESANKLAAGPINEDISKGEENDSKTPEGTEDSRNELNKEKAPQKKNISSWFSRKNQNKAADKSILGGLATEEKKAASAEKGNKNDSNMNESSNTTGEEKKMLSIFSSLTKKKQTKEESPLNVENEKATVEKGKEQPKSKTVSSSKFRLFGSSEKLIDHEKKDKENSKEEELQRTDTSPNQNDQSIAVTHTTVGEMESSSEATENSNEQRNDTKSQELPMENQTSNIEDDEESKKDDTNLTKSKSKSTSMKNLFFSSGKQSKQKAEKNKEEDPMLEKKELENTPTNESICRDDEDEAANKKRSGIINLLFTPPEKRSKRKDEKAKQNSEKDEKKNQKDTEITSNESEFFVEIPLTDSATECQERVKEQEPSMVKDEVNPVGDTDKPSNEESRNMSPKKAKTPSKMNFLFSSGKQPKNKPEEKKEEASKAEQQVVNQKASESIREEDRYGSWDKSKHSAFVNLLFAPPERHAKKVKPKEKVPDNKGQEGLFTVADEQNGEMCHIKGKESSSDKMESLVENSSSKSNAELTNEVKQEEKQDTTVEEGPPSINCDQCEKIISKEEKEISESEAVFSTKTHSTENVVELNNEGEKDNEVIEESKTEVSKDKESKIMTESFENRIEGPAETISSENTNEAIKEVKQDSEPMEKVPIIIVTQDEECINEQDEEMLRGKEEISSEMASGENVIDLKDKNDLQEAPIVENEGKNSITMTEEASSMVESKEFLMDSREFITEITKCFDDVEDEVKHEEICEKKTELELREDSINNEKSSTNILTSTAVSEDTICVTYTTREHSKPEMDDEKDKNIMVKDLPVTDTFEKKNNERETNNFSTKEKRLSGIIDSLFSRTEKHVKPKKDKKKQDSSENEELCEDTMPQSDESKHKAESANKTESTENVMEFTDKGQPSVVIEDQPIIDTPSDEVPNLGKEMDISLGTSSSRMQTLFGSTGKHSKPKKNVKQENTSTKGELSSMAVTANEDLKNEEEVNSLDKAKSSSMRKLLFGKRPKQKYEEHRDLPTASALDDEGNTDKNSNNPATDNKASSIEIGPATSEKPTEIMHEMKEQDQPAMAVEVQEEISEKNMPIQQEKDTKTKRRKTPASGKAGFFSLPDRRGRMRNEVKKQEADMSEEQPQSALKEIKQEEKKITQGNSNKPRKEGLLSSLDRRKRVKHEARMPEVSSEKEENSKPGNVESTSSERERPSLSGNETPRTAIEEFSNERAVDVGEISDNRHKPKSESKEDLLKSSSYPRRKGKRTELKKEDISLQKDIRHTTHVTWDPIKKNLVLHYTDNEGLRRILLEENLCREAPAPRQRRHSYTMAMDEIDAEIFEEIPRASIQSYSSVTSNSKSFGKIRRRAPKARPRSEIVRGNQPLTEL